MLEVSNHLPCLNSDIWKYIIVIRYVIHNNSYSLPEMQLVNPTSAVTQKARFIMLCFILFYFILQNDN